MSEMIEIKAERIREAAEQCPDAKKVLETLFPEVLRPEPNAIHGRITMFPNRWVLLYLDPVEVKRQLAEVSDHTPVLGVWLRSNDKSPTLMPVSSTLVSNERVVSTDEVLK